MQQRNTNRLKNNRLRNRQRRPLLDRLPNRPHRLTRLQMKRPALDRRAINHKRQARHPHSPSILTNRHKKRQTHRHRRIHHHLRALRPTSTLTLIRPHRRNTRIIIRPHLHKHRPLRFPARVLNLTLNRSHIHLRRPARAPAASVPPDAPRHTQPRIHIDRPFTSTNHSHRPTIEVRTDE